MSPHESRFPRFALGRVGNLVNILTQLSSSSQPTNIEKTCLVQRKDFVS